MMDCIQSSAYCGHLEGGGHREGSADCASESPMTTKLYDRTSEQTTLDGIEQIAIYPGRFAE
jgi:hypothetical protein